MASSMNRKDWLKSSGMLLAGGLTMLSPGAIARERSVKDISKRLGSSRKFVSDMEFAQLAPPSIKARLNANENPFGPSPKAKEALIAAIDSGNRYSFGPLRELGKKIVEHEGLGEKQILFAAGSSPILTAGAVYYAEQGGNVVAGDPSYSDMPSRIEEFGGEVRWVPLTDEYKLDLKAMEAKVDENTKMVYLVNPNNPTATIVDTAELKSFCKRVSKKATIFIDEAYIEYLDDPDASSMISLVKEGYDVIVARTFSKLYGFAGLRVGYMVASEEMIDTFDKYTRGGMSISATSSAAALATYLDKDYFDEVKSKTQASKDHLYATLEKEGYEYIPSSANFVMFPINMPGRRFTQEMWKREVGVRFWEFNDQNWCRISIGTMEDMELFASAFHQIS